MAKYRVGDRVWIVEWIPHTAVKLDENGDHDPDQARECERRRCFQTKEQAVAFAESLLKSRADFFGCPAYAEYELISDDDFGELPDGHRWEMIGDLTEVYND